MRFIVVGLFVACISGTLAVAGIITPAHDGEKVVFEDEKLPDGRTHPSLEKGGEGAEKSGDNAGAWEAHKNSPVLDYQKDD